jgi:thiol:disulfide interchange protein DsbD
MNGIPWEAYSEGRLQELRQQGKPVFIDFTAAWCLTCQVNERIALNSSKVVDQFKTLGIVALKADWTSHDEKIARALAQFGRNSIPLYVLYGKNFNDPMILPELLTPYIVLEALKKMESSSRTGASGSDKNIHGDSVRE